MLNTVAEKIGSGKLCAAGPLLRLAYMKAFSAHVAEAAEVFPGPHREISRSERKPPLAMNARFPRLAGQRPSPAAIALLRPREQADHESHGHKEHNAIRHGTVANAQT